MADEPPPAPGSPPNRALASKTNEPAVSRPRTPVPCCFVTSPRLDLTRDQILAHRRRVGALNERLPAGRDSLKRAAWAGLQDSMPRAAVLSIHARVEGTQPDTWADPALVQIWGPRFSAFVVAAEDVPVFTLGRLSTSPAKRAFAQSTADDLERFLAGRTMTYGEAGRGLGRHPNSLRYGAPTGRILIRWEGARQPTIWTIPAPDMGPAEASKELARRHLHVLGPTTAGAFGQWAGVKPPQAAATFEALAGELLPARTPLGEAWILAADEAAFRAPTAATSAIRLLPSGDSYWLLQGRDRELLVPDPRRRAELWTPRVWPGAVLIAGEIAGTWRRAGGRLDLDPWRSVSPTERQGVEAEAESLPLPAADRPISVRWSSQA
jgi:hypothetical protein